VSGAYYNEHDLFAAGWLRRGRVPPTPRTCNREGERMTTTRDHILVERVTDGKYCGDGCPHYHEENSNAPNYCGVFESEDDERGFADCMKFDSIGRTYRLRSCLATPSAVALMGGAA